jgi:Fe-only nitrogenase accessory protein AnfO
MTDIMNIAAFVSESGEIVDFYEEGQLCLFGKVSDAWSITKVIPLTLKREMGLAGLRATLTNTVTQLKDCEVVLVRELRGIVKVYLEELGYRVWKSEGPLIDQLENVSYREQEMLAEEDIAVPSPLPVGEAGDDTYRINLVELIQSGIPHVSREVLMPFFETVSFQKLEIVCEHIPKWFPMELEALGLRVGSQTQAALVDGMMTVTVVPKCGPRSCPPGKRSKGFSCHCG